MITRAQGLSWFTKIVPHKHRLHNNQGNMQEHHFTWLLEKKVFVGPHFLHYQTLLK
jgi:hypothetical protein